MRLHLQEDRFYAIAGVMEMQPLKITLHVTLLRRTIFTAAVLAAVVFFFFLLLLRWCQPPDVTNNRFVVVNF